MERWKVGGIVEVSYELEIEAEDDQEAEARALAILENTAKGDHTDRELQVYVEYVEPVDNNDDWAV